LEAHAGPAYLRALIFDPAYSPSMEMVMDEAKQAHDKGHEYPFCIRRHEDQQPIGTCTLQQVNFHARTGGLGIGMPNPDWHGLGYGREALTLLLQYAFWELNLNRVWLEVADYNQAAKALYAALGFVQEVTLRQYIFRDGVYYNAHIMSLLAAEWAALR
jgi:hypothetical protein